MLVPPHAPWFPSLRLLFSDSLLGHADICYPEVLADYQIGTNECLVYFYAHSMA